MKVVNQYNHPVQVKVNSPSGVQYAHIASRGRIDLSENCSIDNNWLVSNPKVSVIVEAPPAEKKEPETKGVK